MKYPKSRFIIATTSTAPELKECKAKKDQPEELDCSGKKAIKADKFPRLDDKLLEKEIIQAYGVKQNIVDIMTDYHISHSALLRGMNFDNFSIPSVVGSEFVSIEGISKEDGKKLK